MAIVKESEAGKVFDFMANIKERLKESTPDAIVMVEPHKKDCVSIRIEWRVDRWYGAQQIISVEEIMQRNDDIVGYYAALFEHLKSEAMAPYTSSTKQPTPKPRGVMVT